MVMTTLAIGGGALYMTARKRLRKQTKIAAFRGTLATTDKAWRAEVDEVYIELRQEIQAVYSAGVSRCNYLFSEAKSVVQELHQKSRLPQKGNLRSQQMAEFSSATEKRAVRAAEDEINRNLAIAMGSLGLAVAGTLFYPPLGLLSVPGFIWGIVGVYKRTYIALAKEHRITAELVITIMVTVFLLDGFYVLGNTATVVLLLSRKLLLKITNDSKQQLIDVFRLQPRTVWSIVDDTEIEIPFEVLKLGDVVVVHAGETIPVDGTVTAGIASVDQHILTGESQPIEKEAGDAVLASTVVLSGAIYILAEKAGQETVVAKISHILNQTANFKSSTLLQAEVLADRMVVPIIALSVLTMPFLGLLGAVALLDAHPKRRLSVPAPLSILNFLNLASQRGILVKDGRSLELLNGVDTIVFDKTGTLTQEQPHIAQIYAMGNYTEDEILIVAAAVERKQSHPIAKAIWQAATAKQLTVPSVKDAEHKVGYGISARLSTGLATDAWHSAANSGNNTTQPPSINGAAYTDQGIVRVGSIRFMELEGIAIAPEILQIQQVCQLQAHSLVLVAVDRCVVGAIELHATVRPEAKSIIRQLRKQRHIRSMYIISGDQAAPTQRLAAELGIEHYFAQTLPERKAELIAQLQEEGKKVCFIGDGINDTIALKKANVSISLRGASTAATDTAQIVLMDQSLNQLVELFELAREFNTNMNNGFAIMLTPAAACISGALFLHFGPVQAFVWNQIGLIGGIGNAMWPQLKYRNEFYESTNNHIEASTPTLQPLLEPTQKEAINKETLSNLGLVPA